ncbi:MAG TPA: DUF4142 domain-containing protein [Gemmatimonadales bacterium]|jgi:putative membrane protein|nr:DUF4142 domain-containing protein [Gemmatimonadales bacterium]
MSVARLITTAAGLTLAFAAAPASTLHSQTTPARDTSARIIFGKGAPTTAPAQVTLDSLADTAFVREAIAGNLLEVRLGRAAMQRASSPAVKQFGQQMFRDHTTMGNQWSALISRNRLPVKVALDPAQEQQASRLERLSGADFDRNYMNSMIQDHQQDAQAFQSQGLSARSADVRQLASSDLATIQQHLSMAQQVGAQVGASTNVAVAPQNPQNTRVTSQNAQVHPQRVTGRADELKADRKFVEEMGADNTLEIRLGRAAQQKASNSAVKRFADHMVDDFSKWQDRWAGVASRNGMSLQRGMGSQHQEKLDRVQKRSGAEFDRTYMTTVIEHLESMVPYFQNEGRSANSNQVRSLVADELPALQQNLAQARRIGDQVKAETGRSRNVSKNR